MEAPSQYSVTTMAQIPTSLCGSFVSVLKFNVSFVTLIQSRQEANSVFSATAIPGLMLPCEKLF